MFLAGCGNDDAAAVKALKALKAGMGTDENGSVTEVDFSNSQATDDDLVHLKGLPKLSTLFIGSQISDKGMAHVEGLTTLTFGFLVFTADSIQSAASRSPWTSKAVLGFTPSMSARRSCLLECAEKWNRSIVHATGIDRPSSVI